MSISPFSIAIPDDSLRDLADRLARTRWPDAVAGAGWDYGTDAGYLRELAEYWRAGFDWRAQERRLNAFPQFLAEIDGETIHFVHQRSTRSDAIPLLLLHGWPSSFVQMLPILPMLAEPEKGPAFHCVAASLPGFGFSSRPHAPGMSVARIAPLLHRLMRDALGYARYGLRGGDLGAGVIAQMALQHPQAVIGTHTGGTNPWIAQVPDDLSDEERAFVANARQWSMTEMAYAALQSSKPQTAAFGLNDSPAGLAAWIVEKFRRWSDCDGEIERRFTKDDLLTNITIYWATETIGSSMRLYYETVREPGGWGRAEPPAALLMSSKDMFPTPRSWAERSGRIDRWTEIDRGGHFLEWEEPGSVAADLQDFFGSLR